MEMFRGFVHGEPISRYNIKERGISRSAVLVSRRSCLDLIKELWIEFGIIREIVVEDT